MAARLMPACNLELYKIVSSSSLECYNLIESHFNSSIIHEAFFYMVNYMVSFNVKYKFLALINIYNFNESRFLCVKPIIKIIIPN